MTKKTAQTQTVLEKFWAPIIVALIAAGATIVAALVTRSGGTAPSPTAEPFAYQVRIQAVDNGQPLQNADVTIEVPGQAPLKEVTDSEGLARVFIDSSYAGRPGRIIAQATGYVTYVRNIDLRQDTLPTVVKLERGP
jgi:hypothetical protein